jgi:hypothetical protein
MKTPLSLRRARAGLCGVTALLLLASLPPQITAQTTTPATGPQQLLFTGLLGSTNPNPANAHYAQFNAIQSDASGNLYLLLDQGDGIRLLKTDPTATNVLAQTHLGSSGDIGLAMALDPSGNLYVTGTTTSGTLSTTSGAAFPNAADTSINSYIGKFDQNLNPVFLTYAGSLRHRRNCRRRLPHRQHLRLRASRHPRRHHPVSRLRLAPKRVRRKVQHHRNHPPLRHLPQRPKR